MSSLTLSLPDPIRQFVESLVSEDGYPSASDYIRVLVEEDQKKRAEELERLRAQVRVGLDELDRGEYVEYGTAEELAKDVKAEGRKWLREQNRAEAG
jgi:antitoxin ParD1/3/4